MVLVQNNRGARFGIPSTAFSFCEILRSSWGVPLKVGLKELRMLYLRHPLSAEHRIALPLVTFLSFLAFCGQQTGPLAASRLPIAPPPPSAVLQSKPIAPAPTPAPRPRLLSQLPRIASRRLSTEQKYRYYSAIVEASGGEVKPGKVMVLGLRGIDPRCHRHASGENAGPYDDTFVILKRDAQGRQQVFEMLGSTHAGQESSSWAPDGVAQIRPGHFVAVPQGEHEGMPCWLVQTRTHDGHIPCWRDVDCDGVISRREKVRGKTADGILFHNGRFADHGSSIGCQTMRPDIFQRFIDTLGRSSSFDYTLVDANRPLPLSA